MAGETNLNNNLAQQAFTVRGLKALGHDGLPTVTLKNAAGSSVFVLGPKLKIPLYATVADYPVGGKVNLVAYAKASPYEEAWHIDISRVGTREPSGREGRIGGFSRPVTGFQYNAELDLAWLQAHNATPGKYVARAYLSQTANGVTAIGPDSRLEFELRGPPQADKALQPVDENAPSPHATTPEGPPPQVRATPQGSDRAAPESATREQSAAGRTPQQDAGRAAPGPAMQMEIEADALVKNGSVQVSGGQARVQPMSSFGGGWSGGEQLLWSGGSTGAVLDLMFDVPVASKYAFEIYMTRAPDYGQVRFEIDGQASFANFDGIAPQVMAPGPTQLGTFPLQAGKHKVSLMIVGKHAQSTGYLVGIDKLRLYPAGPIN